MPQNHDHQKYGHGNWINVQDNKVMFTCLFHIIGG